MVLKNAIMWNTRCERGGTFSSMVFWTRRPLRPKIVAKNIVFVSWKHFFPCNAQANVGLFVGLKCAFFSKKKIRVG